MTTRPTLVLVPGMDGTGRLFDRFRRALGDRDVWVVEYADREGDEVDLLAAATEGLASYVIVAESFGGPIALRFAARRPRGLVGLVLVATFVRSPLPTPFRGLVAHAPRVFFARPPPPLALRFAMIGADADDALAEDVRATLASVSPASLTARARRTAAIDVRAEASAVSVPVLVVAAARDRLVARTHVEALHEALLPRAASTTYVVLDGPHLLLQARAEESARAIEAWIRRAVDAQP